ncbi:IS1595 family transposase [Sphingosinicellaceae bacterium]|nr:IS1595 family transposase [Sphingosinicellaceae bacterium]
MVEADEAYIGRIKGKPTKRGAGHKMKVLSLVDRNTGTVRSFTDVSLTATQIFPIIHANISREARLMTDESNLYTGIGASFASHETVMHGADEYVRGDVFTNTVEGYFSIFKRGMRGIYQHCGEQHLHRYLAEFDFRYSNRIALGTDDATRAVIAIRGVVGKRITYQRPDRLAA